MRIVVLAAALAAEPAPDCPDDPGGLAAAALVICAIEEARRLEPSGETASDVADAVVSVCQPVSGKAIAMVNRCRDIHIPAGKFDDTMRRRALREVIEIRAKRSPSRRLP